MNKKCLFYFDSANSYLDDVINKGSKSTYIITTEDISELRIEAGPAVEILTLHTSDMSAA